MPGVKGRIFTCSTSLYSSLIKVLKSMVGKCLEARRNPVGDCLEFRYLQTLGSDSLLMVSVFCCTSLGSTCYTFAQRRREVLENVAAALYKQEQRNLNRKAVS